MLINVVLFLICIGSVDSFHRLVSKCQSKVSFSRIFNANAPNLTPKAKTKVGRPQRRSSSQDSSNTGRVSVYCVGDSINIKELVSFN
jgi:hypothetical protein